VVCWNKAAEAIIDYAVGQEVSVVVMATHGYSAPERWPMGSIAETVLRSMQVPVLLIHASSALNETL
jgi:nucleotide-binding universal stress UspA family protein